MRFAEIPGADEGAAHSWQDAAFLGEIATGRAALGASLARREVVVQGEEIDEVGEIEIDAVGVAAEIPTSMAGCTTVAVHCFVTPKQPFADTLCQGLHPFPVPGSEIPL